MRRTYRLFHLLRNRSPLLSTRILLRLLRHCPHNHHCLLQLFIQIHVDCYLITITITLLAITDHVCATLRRVRLVLQSTSRRRGCSTLLGGLVLRVLLLALGAGALLRWRLQLNGWRSPQFNRSDNAAAFCETATCRFLSYSHLYYLNLKLLFLPLNLAHDWSMTTVPNLHDLSDARSQWALLRM